MKTPAQNIVIVSLTLLLLALATWLDVVTGSEINVQPLFVLPLIVGAWFVGLRWGLWLSVITMLVRRGVDHWWEQHFYSKKWIFWEVGLANLALYVLIVFSFHTFKRGRRADRERIERLESALRVCPSCNRVPPATLPAQNLDELLRAQDSIPPERRLCPECAGARQEREPSR